MIEMKTLELAYSERRRATVQVPATYDPAAHAGELAVLVNRLDAKDVTTDQVISLTWTEVSAQPEAPVLLEVIHEEALYTAKLIAAADAFGAPIQEWSTPQHASALRAAAREYLARAGWGTLADDDHARFYDRYPVVSTAGGSRVTAYLLLTHANRELGEADRLAQAESMGASPDNCFADLHEWAIRGSWQEETDTGDLITHTAAPTGTGPRCEAEAREHPHHTCWCGKFNATKHQS